MPTLADFLTFIANVMGITTSALPSNSPYPGYAFAVAIATVNQFMQCIPGNIYALAVYNLAGDRLINFAQDTPPSTYFTQQRQAFGITNSINNPRGFVGGVVSASSDESSSTTIAVTDAMKGLTIGDLQNLKTPWGQTYLGFAQGMGTMWGLS